MAITLFIIRSFPLFRLWISPSGDPVFSVEVGKAQGESYRIISQLGSIGVRESDLRLNGREFDPRPPHY